MDRRGFLKLCSLAGLGVAGSQLIGSGYSNAVAAEAPKLVVFGNAAGGWDTSRIADPKGDRALADDGPIFNEDFAASAIVTAAGTSIRYAPLPGNQELFEPWGRYMTVINGIDCLTNSHAVGQINATSGRIQQNSPCFMALYAAAVAGAQPLAFITNGGYDETAGVPVAKTRLGSTGALMPLLYPNRLYPESDNQDTFYSSDTLGRIRAARTARLEAMQAQQHLPLIRDKMGLLLTARSGMDELKRINDYLPTDGLSDQAQERQAEIIAAAYMAGLCSTASIVGGGFDSHGNNDAQQDQRRPAFFAGILKLLELAQAFGFADRLLIVMGSEFGRTPGYNGASGKDHWTVGEMIVIDPSGKIPGGRVIGESDAYGQSVKVDPSTLAPDPAGFAIRPANVHQWLRRHTGIEEHEVTKLYPVTVEAEMSFG